MDIHVHVTAIFEYYLNTTECEIDKPMKCMIFTWEAVCQVSNKHPQDKLIPEILFTEAGRGYRIIEKWMG